MKPMFQSDYKVVVDKLDEIMAHAIYEMGMSEDDAQAWLKDLVTDHYCTVWRAMNRIDGALSSTTPFKEE
jgi:hypothetical protein